MIHDFQNKTVAVTGASGYLAAVLIDALKERFARVLSVSRRDLPDVESLQADISSEECWREVVSKADIIFHLAGNTSVYSAIKHPADSLNSTVLPIVQLVKAAQEEGCRPRVIYASTATVYGLTKSLPVSEDSEVVPVTNYDLHKLFAEKQLELASKQGVLEGVSLRLANVYGPSSSVSLSDDRGILNKITKSALTGDALQLYGDGNYLRDYVYIDDVVNAFMAAALGEGVVGRSFNVASGKGTTVRQAFQVVAQQVEKVTGRKVGIKSVPWPDGADAIEMRNFVADITNLYKAVGWRPQINLEEGVGRMTSSFVKRYLL